MKINLKPLVYLNKQRKDNNYSVIIRIGYESKYANIDTGIFAGKTELKKRSTNKRIGEIGNATILDICNKKIEEYKKLIREAQLPENDGVLPNNCTVQDIKALLLKGTVRPDSLDFMKLFKQFINENTNSPSIRIYEAAYNHLQAFTGTSLLVDDITPNKLKEFEKHLSNTITQRGTPMGSRGINLYLSQIRTVYNWIMDEYEYKGYSFRYPFRKYEIPKATYPKTKALTKEQLRAIIETPLTGIRANRARDLFVISLLSLGTNAKDLYQLETVGRNIEYKRSKTKHKRDDEAFISIAVQPELKPYISKYWTKICTRPFAQMYASPEQLNRAILEGLKQVVRQVNKLHGNGFLWDIDYYDARRTVASIMRNRLGISKDDVAQCLNHVDKDMKTTDVYIEQDFTRINKLNRMFIDWLFSESASADQH